MVLEVLFWVDMGREKKESCDDKWCKERFDVEFEYLEVFKR